MHHSIEVEHLSFSYPDGHLALADISLHIAPGEKVALVGPNGAGKSTLVLHLNGILPAPMPHRPAPPVPAPQVQADGTGKVWATGQGRVTVCGLEVGEKTLGRVRAAVGLVFQNPDDQLFSPTVYEDVAFGPLYQGLGPDEVADRVTSALSAVSMQSYARRISHHLSMGEKKRIAIATVLSMNPEVLVLDEPTSGLDPRARRSLIHLLFELPMTMLVSSHDLAMVRELLPRMVIMDEGRIVADGPTADLMKDEQLLESHGLEKP
jgi:cobalt/nickel transport system ATP-binding protein